MSTPAERKAYIEQQRKDSEKYGVGPTKRVLGDMSFIDKSGNIVRPTRDNPYPDSSYSGKYTGRKKHYNSDKAYGASKQYGRQHEHHNYSGSQGLSGMLSILGIFVGIFFLSNNVTGNVVGLSNTTSSWIGGILILIGLVAGFFYVKNRKVILNQ